MLRKSFTLGLAIFASTSAFAATPKICVVDGETALNDTEEGKAAQAHLETLYSSKQAELEKLQGELQKAVSDFQAREMILSDDAKATTQQELARKQADLQQRAMNAEAEMQQTYQNLLAGMETKLQTVAKTVGAAKGCTVLLQKAAVLYMGADTLDVTPDIIKALNAIPAQ